MISLTCIGNIRGGVNVREEKHDISFGHEFGVPIYLWYSGAFQEMGDLSVSGLEERTSWRSDLERLRK